MAETEQIVNERTDSNKLQLLDTLFGFAPKTDDQERVMIRFALCFDRFVQDNDGRISEAEHLSKMQPSNDGMKDVFNENLLTRKDI